MPSTSIRQAIAAMSPEREMSPIEIIPVAKAGERVKA